MMNHRNFKVFVVDDNPVFGALIHKSIKNSGENCDVMIFQNSSDFFSAFNHNKVQLAIIDDDLNEATIDGLYVLKDIMRSGNDVKVIALSGEDSVNRVLEYMDAGAWKYISKSDKLWPEKIENYVKEAIMDSKRSKLLDNITYEQAIDLVLRKDDLLSSFFNNFPALFAILDNTGKFLMANDKWEEKLGWRKSDLKHLNIVDVVCNSCNDKFIECFECEQLNKTEFYCLVQDKSGEKIGIDWQVIKNNDNFFCIGKL